MTSPNLPFTAKPHWFFRVSAFLAFLILIGVGFSPPEDGVLKFWAESSWFFRIQFVVVFGCAIPIGVLEAIFHRTVFDSKGITRRYWYGWEKFKPYWEIEQVECYADFLKIIFSDGSSFKIWRSEAKARDVMQIIESCITKEVLVKFK